ATLLVKPNVESAMIAAIFLNMMDASRGLNGKSSYNYLVREGRLVSVSHSGGGWSGFVGCH
ncbi:MAG: hypothetical protein WB476_05145, partial [Azonexus sp.]